MSGGGPSATSPLELEVVADADSEIEKQAAQSLDARRAVDGAALADAAAHSFQHAAIEMPYGRVMNSKLSKRTLSRVILCALLFASGSLLAGVRVMGGQWEHTMTSDGQAQPRKITACMTGEEAAAFNGDSKTGRAYFEKQAHGPCKIKTFEIQGNTMSYALTCGDRSIENKVTFHGETSEGVTITKAPDGTHTMHTKSRRLGACP